MQFAIQQSVDDTYKENAKTAAASNGNKRRRIMCSDSGTLSGKATKPAKATPSTNAMITTAASTTTTGTTGATATAAMVNSTTAATVNFSVITATRGVASASNRGDETDSEIDDDDLMHADDGVETVQNTGDMSITTSGAVSPSVLNETGEFEEVDEGVVDEVPVRYGADASAGVDVTAYDQYEGDEYAMEEW